MHSSLPDDPNTIRLQMEIVRRRVDERVDRLATNTRQLLDWRHHVRRHPVGFTAAGFLLGAWLSQRGWRATGNASEQPRRAVALEFASPVAGRRHWLASLARPAWELAQSQLLPTVGGWLWRYAAKQIREERP